MSVFHVWRTEYGEEDALKITGAWDAAAAAEEWAEIDDAYSADYLIVGGQECEVSVREEGSDTVQRFIVYGEAVTQYTAREAMK